MQLVPLLIIQDLTGYIKLVGIEAYRIRIGDYRVIYEITESQITIDVIKINHRKEVYK
ncbi:toxin-antitoxin system, toxin component, RelE family (plasmid) [Bergeyella porcorum]|uniref:Toxin-antitoxin system, toxin component, RelE family n=1 Tax=Bergeyella porcorum TaxID=1735111 RepID=A0AAU0F656_9FLAO